MFGVDSESVNSYSTRKRSGFRILFTTSSQGRPPHPASLCDWVWWDVCSVAPGTTPDQPPMSQCTDTPWSILLMCITAARWDVKQPTPQTQLSETCNVRIQHALTRSCVHLYRLILHAQTLWHYKGKHTQRVSTFTKHWAYTVVTNKHTGRGGRHGQREQDRERTDRQKTHTDGERGAWRKTAGELQSERG